MKRASLIVAILVMSCRGHDSKLQERVQSYCRSLRSDLDQAASQYSKLAPALAETAPENQRELTVGVLAVESIGTTEQVRRARMHDFKSRLGFCASARQMDDHKLSDFQLRSETLVEQLIAPDALAHAEKTVDLLRQYSSLLAEIEAIPYLE